MRVGFIGSGRHAQGAHLRVYSQLSESCELAGIADPDVELATRVAARFGVPNVFATHTELIARGELDACVVTLPPVDAAEKVIIDLLNAGIASFVEKPLAGSPAGADRIIEAQKQSGTLLRVGFHKRCDPATIVAREEIVRLTQSGELGAMTYGRVHVSHAGDWMAGGYADTLKGNAPPRLPSAAQNFPGMSAEAMALFSSFASVHGHQFDWLQHLLGEHLELTYSEPSKVLLCVRTTSGVPAVFEFTPYRSCNDWIESALVCFEKGYVKVHLPPPLALDRAGEVEFFRDCGEPGGARRIRPVLRNISALHKQAELFLAATRGDATPLCTGFDARACLSLARDWSVCLTAAE
jgi:predicted dehydrogenase